MNTLKKLKKELVNNANSKQAAILQRFFKTQKGQYGYGDNFLGIRVPIQRQIAKSYYDLSFDDLQNLLNDKYHEFRMAALIILNHKFLKGSDSQRKKIFGFYLKNYKNINNWDLVDISAPNIVGAYLLNKPKKILFDLAGSKNLWKKRIAMVSTLAFIRQNRLEETLDLSLVLINDKHDLINKATGWMLREVGKRDKKKLIEFLNKNSKTMPRIALYYAIEKMPQKQRIYYLKK